MINGFLLINKPLRFTAHDIISVIKKRLNVNKAGHTGTLDPLATGLMLVGIGEGTKFLNWHTYDKKSYIAKIKLGETSNTYDGEGIIESTNFEGNIGKQKLIEVIDTFKGKITQTPPKYSAIKIQGKKACNMMREGGDIQMPSRNIEIFKIEIIKFEYPILELDITCSSGTYIRSIANDIGKKLGCGAYLIGLIRTGIENIKLSEAIEIDDISKEKLLPLDFGIQNIEILEVSEKIIGRLKQGHRIKLDKNLEKNLQDQIEKLINNIKINKLRIYSSGKFFGIGEIKGDILRGVKIIN